MTARGDSGSSPQSRSTVGHLDQPTSPDWGWALSRDPFELAELVRSGKARLWLERLVRALDVRLSGALRLPEEGRASADARWLPRDIIPIVGAFPDQSGALGVLKMRSSKESLCSISGRAGEVARGDEPLLAAQAGAALACNTMIELLPDVPRPMVELQVGHSAAGDSIALPAAIGALLHLFGLGWPADVIASGGVDVDRGVFVPVAASTIESKAATACAWGFRRIILVEEASAGSDHRQIGALQVERVPNDPAELAVAIARLEGVDLDEEDVARALTVFDLRVGRAGAHMLDRVLETTEPFIEGSSPLVRHVSLDMRSRAYLHAGRTAEAHAALDAADALRGQGDLPDGRLRDVLRYQQPAHRSIVHLDLGEWSDDHPAHRKVDELIADLDSGWSTKHERLMRLFLANTRARRNEYLGRLHGDVSRFERAWEDLHHFHCDWDELLERFARRELRLPDTSRARIENQVIDVAWSRVASCGDLPDPWRSSLESSIEHASPLVEFASDAIFEFKLPSGSSCFVGGSGFDAIARLKKHLALEHDGVPTELEPLRNATSCLVLEVPGFPWFHWLELAAMIARRDGFTLSLPENDDADSFEHTWRFVLGNPNGIGRIIALRTFAILGSLDRSIPAPDPPEQGTALRDLFDELAKDPGSIIPRAPY